ncbi:hypothetical protein HDE_00487 [Halotydeus destructor]|nr:hypothetical protein HDE_00487 [Halotydeus destructor]
MDPEPGVFFIKRSCFTAFMEKFCQELVSAEVPSALSVREKLQAHFAAGRLKPTLTVSLEKNIMSCLTLDIDIKEWKPSQAEMLELERDIIRAVQRTILKRIFQEGPTAVLFVIVCDRHSSSGRHLHFPEIVVEADTYNVLVSQIRDEACIANEAVTIDCPSHLSMPFTTNSKKPTPYIPKAIYSVWRKGDELRRVSLCDSSDSKLLRFFDDCKNKNSQNAVQLQQAFKDRKSSRFETLLLMLLSPIPCVEKWSSFLFVLPTRITKYSKENTVMNLVQRTDRDEGKLLYVSKDLEEPRASIFHQDGRIKWNSIMKRSEYHNIYKTLVPAVVVTKTIVPENVNLPYPGIFWMETRADAESLMPTSSIHGEPLLLCESHNRLVSEIACLCGGFRNSPHPILSLLASGTIIGPVIYAFYQECGGDEISLQHVCDFFKSALSRFLDFGNEHPVMQKIARVSEINKEVARKLCSNFSFAGLKRYVFQKTFLEQVQQLDLIDGHGEPVEKQGLPVFISASFYHQYMTDVAAAEAQSSMTDAVNNMYENLMTFARNNERGGGVSYQIFNPSEKIWRLENGDFYHRFFKTFKDYVVQVMMKLELDKKLIETVKKTKPQNDVLASLPRKNCKSAHKMDNIEYFLLMEDSTGKFKIFDMIESALVTPMAEHECTGHHAIKLRCKFSQFQAYIESDDFLPLVNRLYFSNFIHRLKKILLQETEIVEQDEPLSYSAWTSVYRRIVLRELENEEPESFRKIGRPLLDQMVSMFIYICQTCKFQDRLTSYLMTRLASIYVKNSAEREILLWTGVGSNGKTHLMTLLQSCLGTYAATVPSSVFTTEKDFDDTMCRNVFTGCLLAADELRDFDGSVLKRLASNGEITARGMYKSQVVGRISARFMAALNTIPNRALDKAAQDRLICIPFQSRFYSQSKTVPPTVAEQVDKAIFRGSNSASETNFEMPLLLTMIGVLMLKLSRETGVLEVTTTPPCVLSETSRVRERCDSYNKFIVHFELKQEPSASIALSKVRHAINLFTQQFPNQHVDDIITTFVKKHFHLITFQGDLEPLKPRHAVYLLDTNYELLTCPVRSRRRVPDDEVPANDKEEIEFILQEEATPRMALVQNIESLIVFKNLTLKRVRDAELSAQSKRAAGMFPVFDIKRQRKF